MRTSRPIGRLFFALLVGATGAACSLLIDVSGDQCSSDGDCAARGAEFAGARCVQSACVAAAALEAGPGSVVDASMRLDASDARAPVEAGVNYTCIGKNPPLAPKKPSVAYQVTLTDLLTEQAVPSLKVSVCANLTDPNCTTPSSTAMTDAKGVAHLVIDTSKQAFDGYIDVVPIGPDGGSPVVDGGDDTTYIPARIYYTSIPITDDLVDDYQVMKFGALKVFASLFKTKADFSTGVAFLIAEDCDRVDTEGVSFGVDSTIMNSTQRFYLQSAQPSTTATHTDPSGIGGYVNLPTGTRLFTTSFADGGAPIGSLNAYIRPSTIMLAKIAPSITP